MPAYFGGIALMATIFILWRDRTEKIREQAQKVAGWVSKDDSYYYISVRNASDLPCSRLTVLGNAGYHRDSEGRVRISLSKFEGDGVDGHLKPGYFSVIGPGATIETHKVPSKRGPVRLRKIEFMDAAGRNWSREEGALRVRRPSRARAIFHRVRRWVRRKVGKDRPFDPSVLEAMPLS